MLLSLWLDVSQLKYTNSHSITSKLLTSVASKVHNRVLGTVLMSGRRPPRQVSVVDGLCGAVLAGGAVSRPDDVTTRREKEVSKIQRTNQEELIELFVLNPLD